jgi:hypothetical protein
VVIEMCVKYGGVEVYSTSMVTDVPVLLGRDTRGPKGTGHRGAERHQGERREQQGDRDRRGPQGQRDPTPTADYLVPCGIVAHAQNTVAWCSGLK